VTVSSVADLAAPDGVTAVVGAGGKKTTLYALCDLLDRPVLTSTVRIPIFDDRVAAVRVTDDPRRSLAPPFPLGLVPERDRTDRYRGYDVETVTDLGRAHDGPVLVKADGARNRLFKAPNDDEPRIPRTADRVLVVASVHAVGRTLNEESVHRPERVADLAGLDVGEELTAEAMATVLAHPDGGRKGIPEQADRVVLLNMVDDATLEARADAVAARLAGTSGIDDVVLARMDERRLVGTRHR
jgi:probable selenium-dependent hydroxylase accessory protein YqeC